MKIILATSNPHKLEEIKRIFKQEHAEAQVGEAYGGSAMERIQWDGLSGVCPVSEPVEDQETFAGNAALKARHYAHLTGLPCLADDSGLEVDALGGEPGVRSARFAGVEGPRRVVDPANNALMLKRLGELSAEKRSARFVCVMSLCGVGPADFLAVRSEEAGGDVGRPGDPTPVARADQICEWISVHGTVEGRILGPGDPGYGIDNPIGRGANGFGYDPLFLVPRLGKTTAELSSAEKNAISHRGHAARKMWRALAARVGSMTA